MTFKIYLASSSLGALSERARIVDSVLPRPPQLYNYFEDANYVYLVLEMCHNGELNQYLKTTRKRLSEAEGKWKYNVQTGR